MALRIIRLEDRIVLDGAMTDTSLAVADASDHDSEKQSAVDDGHDTFDDSENDPSDPTHVLDGAPEQAPPLYDVDDPPTPTGYSSVLIINNVDSVDQYLNAVNDSTLVLQYSAENSTPQTILESVQAALGNTRVDSIAIAGDSIGQSGMRIFQDMTLSVSTLAVNETQQAFWGQLGALITEGGNIDLFCDGIAESDGSDFLADQLASISGQTVTINYSCYNDQSGVQESTAENADETQAAIPEGLITDSEIVNVTHTDISADNFADEAAAAVFDNNSTDLSYGLNIVLVDTTLSDYEQLAQSVDSDAVVILYNGETESADDVLDRVIEYAMDVEAPIESLSIMSHGKTGEFKLGNEWIDAANLNLHSESWQSLNAIMIDGGNIYLYGCNVTADSEAGQALLDQLADLTDADVFASDDITGLGGDWDLEAAATGDEAERDSGLDTQIDTTALAAYAGTLATPVINDDTFSVPANAIAPASVGTVSASDADTGDTLTYSITSGNTFGAFAIDADTGEITVAFFLDPAGSVYELTVQVSDSDGNTDTATITINVTDANYYAPVADDATVSLSEDAANSTSVHTVVATDDDTDAVLTYAITAGNDDGVFTIDPDTGEITVADNTTLDMESTATYALTVQVSDGYNTDTAAITINVTDVNEFAPVADDATVSLSEDAANDSSVHTVAATDADADADLTYAITAGNDDGVFTIDPDTGEITVVDNTNLDFESTAGYALTVQVADGTNTDTATITINVTDVNEFAPVINDETFSIAENAGVSDSVGTVSASDQDSGATLTYSITAGNAAGAFAIDADTGEITVNGVLDRESTGSYALTVQVSDGANTDTATITINVTDVNEYSPTINAATVYISESAPDGTAVHIAAASDYDADATLSYSITAGNDDGVFAIDASTGEITIFDNGPLDSDVTSSYSLTVQVSDGTYTNSAEIYFHVIGSDPVAESATVDLAENSANGTSVHTVAASDADAGDTLTYTITGGNAAGIFTIDADTGEITVADNTGLDRESIESVELTVQVSDGKNTDTATITINIIDVNEYAPVADDATVSLPEDAANDTSVHTVVATDADATADLSYSITAGNDDGVFAIDPDTGEITVADNTNLDFESTTSYALTVQASDGTNTDTATITINITDVNEYAPVADDATVSLAEDAANDTSVHTVVATDADATADLSYSITAGNDDGVFAIDPDTGEITVADNTNLDMESTASYALTVAVSDGTNTDTATITINITDVNEFAPVADDATVSLAEDAASDTSVHTVVATDADATAVLTYAITSGNDDGVFAIDPDTGEIRVGDNTNLDFESTTGYALTVAVSDGTNTDTATITINITDVNEFAPVADDATVSLSEDAANSTSVHTVVATDADATADLSYSITAGNDDGVFAIDPDTGEITVGDNTNLDFESTTGYALTVQVSDGINTDTATITINITDVNEYAPVADDATVSLAEDAANSTSVHTVVATDADATAVLTYAITAGNDDGVFAIDPNTGEITVADNTNLDMESTASYALTVQVSDSTNTDTATITINITDVNEYAPVADDATVSLSEDAANSTSVHTVVATDADATADLSYSITAGNDDGVFAIDPDTGEITVGDNTNLDFESTTGYALTVQVSDGTNTDTATITINITDANEYAPVADDATVSLSEDAANDTSVHTVVATDADATAVLTYAITAGNDDGVFAIDPNTGAITVGDNTNLDMESTAGYALTVQVSDGTNTDTATITVNVSDVNEFAPVADDATVSLSEDAANSTSVHTVVATDADATADLSYSITAGNDDGVFAIDPDTGEIMVADNTNLDFESTTGYALTVQVSDGANTDTATITINITDANEYAPVADDATVSLAEDAANSTSVHTVVATDADATAVLTYAITSGNDDGIFAIDPNTGEITVADNTNLDFESTTVYALTVQVSDGTNTDTATITINVSDVNDSAPVADDATVNLSEDAANGTSVHTVVATDADATADLSYSITAGNDEGVFAIDPNTGEITVADNATVDLESTASYALTVQVSDGINTDTATITINITDVNEFSPVANDATVSLAENAANNTSVHTVVATDADATAVLTYAITAGNDDGVFAVDPDTGEITVADNSTLDFDSTADYSLTVQVSDGINADDSTIIVNIEKEDPVSSTDDYTEDHTDPDPDSESDENDTENDETGQDDFAEEEDEENRDPGPPSVNGNIGDVTSENSTATDSSNDISTHADGIGPYHAGHKFYRLNYVYGEQGLPPEYETPTQADESDHRKNGADARIRTELDEGKSWEKDDVGSADFDLAPSKTFFFSVAGLATLVAGYVGWITSGISFLFGFFTSTPLWKSFDPIPIFDEEKNNEDYLDEWGADPSVVDIQEKGVDTILGDNEPIGPRENI